MYEHSSIDEQNRLRPQARGFLDSLGQLGPNQMIRASLVWVVVSHKLTAVYGYIGTESCSLGVPTKGISGTRCPDKNGTHVCCHERKCYYDEEDLCNGWYKNSTDANNIAMLSTIIVFSVVGLCCCFCVAWSYLQTDSEEGNGDEGEDEKDAEDVDDATEIPGALDMTCDKP